MNDETRAVLHGIAAGVVTAVASWLLIGWIIPRVFAWSGCWVTLFTFVAGPIASLWFSILVGQKVHEGVEAQTALRAEQTRRLKQITELCSRSLAAFEALPNHLLTSESYLDRAQKDFAERAFAPFWEAIERSAVCLGRFDADVKQIAADSQDHAKSASGLDLSPPAFPVRVHSVKALAAANTTNERMRQIVREAQRDFQFATIFEQRRTNQILIAGFNSLGQAIDGLGDRLESSIHDLGKQIEQVSSSMTDVADAIEAQTIRHDKALEMLDNIQRRRVPHPKRFGDGAY